jgi:hypothetical protein
MITLIKRPWASRQGGGPGRELIPDPSMAGQYAGRAPLDSRELLIASPGYQRGTHTHRR